MTDPEQKAREYAEQTYVLPHSYQYAVQDFMAGWNGALSPLTSDQAEDLARAACRLMAETDTLEAHGHAILSEFQRLRGIKG
jgi:hypothetical protein